MLSQNAGIGCLPLFGMSVEHADEAVGVERILKHEIPDDLRVGQEYPCVPGMNCTPNKGTPLHRFPGDPVKCQDCGNIPFLCPSDFVHLITVNRPMVSTT